MNRRKHAQWNDMLKRIFLTLLLLLPTALPALAETVAARVEVVVPAGNSGLQDMAGAIQHALQQRLPDTTVTIHTSDNYNSDGNANNLLIAVGDPLLAWLAQNKPNRSATIAFNVSSAAYLSASPQIGKTTTALYRDQPLARQLRLAKLLLPNLRQVAVIHGATPLPQSPDELRRQTGITVNTTNIDNQADWPKLLSILMRGNDALLGIDDVQIYNSDNIRSILLTTYRHGKVLIGPNRAFVGAGSLASCYTASDQYLQQLVDMVASAMRDRRLPRPQYPRNFRVVTNPQVAASLGLNIADEKILTSQLQNSPEECGDGC